MQFTGYLVIISDDSGDRSVRVVILIRRQAEDGDFAVEENFTPKVFESEQLVISEELIFDEKQFTGLERTDHNTSICRTEYGARISRHWPVFPITNLSFENSTRCSQRVRGGDALVQVYAAGAQESS